MNSFVKMIFTWVVVTGLSVTVVFQGAHAEDDLKTEELVKLSLDDLMDMTVVTATKTEIPLSKVTKSIGVVSRKDISEAQEYYFPEMVDNVPGVMLRRNGGPGSLSAISIRGAGSQYTQFQYNGFPFRDAAHPQNTFNSFLPDLYFSPSIKSIEVLKGTHSTLYGSQAMGGVINIIPEKWEMNPRNELRTEVGENRTFFGSARLAYGKERYYVDISPVYITTNGEDNGGDHSYDYDKYGFTAGGGARIGENASLEFSSFFSDSESALNGVTPSLDMNHELVENKAAENQHDEKQIYQLGMIFNHEVNSIWDYTLKGSYSETERHYFWSKTSGDQSNYDGAMTYLEMQNNINPMDWLSFIIGFDYDKTEYNGQEAANPYENNYSPITFDYNWYMWDVFAKAHLSFFNETLLIEGGGRYNAHEEFDSKTVWEASAAYIFEKTGTKVHGHVGTGYRTPSLYEAYGGYVFMGQLITIGNENLEPEESTSYEAGVDQFLMDNKINVGATCFRIDFDNLISYDMFDNAYINSGEAKTEGIEFYFRMVPADFIRFNIAYTYIDAQKRESSSTDWGRQTHLPENKVNITANIYPTEKLTLYCRLTWMDEKIVPLYDPYYTQVEWEEDGATLIDASATYTVDDHWKLWLKVDNLFDEAYSEGGFTMPGRWIYGGVKFEF